MTAQGLSAQRAARAQGLSARGVSRVQTLSMDLLVLCPHFTPDTAPTGTVMTAIAGGLVDRGHRLHIVTSLPWYTEHAVEPEWRGRMWRTETTEWGRITRVHPFPTDKRNIQARAAGFAGFVGLASVLAALTPKRPDVVLAMSPPLPIGLAGMSVARLRRAPGCCACRSGTGAPS